MARFEGNHNIQINGGYFGIINAPQDLRTAPLVDVLKPIHNASHTRNRKTSPPNSQCCPHTREKVINKIISKAREAIPDALDHIQWLYGYVGCGKSAIAQNVGDQMAEHGRLLGSFFCFRADGERNKIANVPTTLAFQLSVAVPQTADLIRKAVEKEPALVGRGTVDIDIQMRRLVYEPFKNALSAAVDHEKATYLIIIDGLDECEDHDQVEDFILGILSFVRDNPSTPLRFLISSRVEEHIRSHLHGDLVAMVNLVEWEASEDIEKSLQTYFAEQAKSNRVIQSYGCQWPSKEELDRLVKRVNGSFIFASTLAKYIVGRPDQDVRLDASPLGQAHARDDGLTPMERLNLALDIKHGLDGLYTFAFLRAEHLPNFRNVVAALAWIRVPLTIKDLARMIGVDNYKVTNILVRLQAVIQVPDDDLTAITIFHTSLVEFLQSEERAGRFYVPRSALDPLFRQLLGSAESLPKFDLYHATVTLWEEGWQQPRANPPATPSMPLIYRRLKRDAPEVVQHLYPFVHDGPEPLATGFLADPERSQRWHTPVDHLITRILNNAASIPYLLDLLTAILVVAEPAHVFNVYSISVLVEVPIDDLVSSLTGVLQPVILQKRWFQSMQVFSYCWELQSYLRNPDRSHQFHVSQSMLDAVYTRYLLSIEGIPQSRDLLAIKGVWGGRVSRRFCGRLVGLPPGESWRIDLLYILIPESHSERPTPFLTFLRDEQRAGQFYVSPTSADHLMEKASRLGEQWPRTSSSSSSSSSPGKVLSSQPDPSLIIRWAVAAAWEPFPVFYDPRDKISDVKSYITDKTGLSPYTYNLIYAGKYLENHETLRERGGYQGASLYIKKLLTCMGYDE